jgi:dTDP-glucose pyrophosphorylase
MNILLLMSGGGDAFREAGYPYPKNLVEIDGLPLVQRVVENLSLLQESQNHLIALVQKEENRRYHTGEVLGLLAKGCTVLEVPAPTAGAACSALLAVEHIDNDEPLVIFNGDQVIDVDLRPLIGQFVERDLDGGIIVFQAVHPRWSYVRCNDEGFVIETAEKRPISNLATAGIYYFKRGADFVTAAKEMIRKDAAVEGNFFVCPSYNEMILRQAKIGVATIPRQAYFSLANPKGVEAYEHYLLKSGRS